MSKREATFETLIYDNPLPAVARITMNRPERRNAQDLQMTYELNDAFNIAAQDDDVKVIILTGAGPHFSSGHDLMGDSGKTWRDFDTVGTWGNFDAPGHEGMMSREVEIYYGMCERWRNIGKPTIAQVQGKCIAGGLMLAWACDLIIAGEDALFQDPVVNFGVCGNEFFMHPWEVGARKAKEWLFTSDWINASQAEQLGMVNRVVANDRLAEETLSLAARIAQKPMFALRMTKEAVNQTQDAQGRRTAMLQAFSLHQLCHSHNSQRYGIAVDPDGLPEPIRSRVKEALAARKAAE